MVDAASHGRHDRFGIADALAGGALPSTVETCPSCGALHRDLLSIQTAIRHAWTPRRPRDLRLVRGDLARGRDSLRKRLISGIGSSRDAVTRPLSVGLVSLGIAGLVLANVAAVVGGGVGLGGASAAASPEIGDTAARAPRVSTPVDVHAVDPTSGTDPLVVISVASLAAGGTMLGLRGVATRARAMR